MPLRAEPGPSRAGLGEPDVAGGLRELAGVGQLVQEPVTRTTRRCPTESAAPAGVCAPGLRHGSRAVRGQAET